MIKIHNNQIDLILQIEDSVAINKVFNKLTLEIDNVLIICTELFFTRLIQHLYEDNKLDEHILHIIEESLKSSKNYIDLSFTYKGKIFNFYFIILSTESKTISNPFKGDQEFKIGFREIKI